MNLQLGNYSAFGIYINDERIGVVNKSDCIGLIYVLLLHHTKVKVF